MGRRISSFGPYHVAIDNRESPSLTAQESTLSETRAPESSQLSLNIQKPILKNHRNSDLPPSRVPSPQTLTLTLSLTGMSTSPQLTRHKALKRRFLTFLTLAGPTPLEFLKETLTWQITASTPRAWRSSSSSSCQIQSVSSKERARREKRQMGNSQPISTSPSSRW